MLARCLQYHPRLRFAAMAILPVFPLPRFRVVRAVIGLGDSDILLRELRMYPCGESVELRLAVIAAPDARLVSNDNNQISLRLRRCAKRENTFYELAILRRMHIAVIDIDHPVAVKKKRFA